MEAQTVTHLTHSALQTTNRNVGWKNVVRIKVNESVDNIRYE